MVHVAYDTRYLGYLVLTDEIKEEAPTALATLKEVGVRQTAMLTGDKRLVGERVADTLKIDRVYAELLPHDKVACLEGLMARKTGALVFVGDGINDAPVLARADVGVSMGLMGTDAATYAADVVLMDDKLSGLPRAIRLSRRTLAIVKQNVAFSLGVKSVVLLLGALGLAGMWWAVFADVGVCLLAILNAMRALKPIS